MANRDMVSKAEVLDIYAELYDEFDDAPGIIKVLHRVYDKINRLNPQENVEQEPKTGHWVDSAGADKCSVCGATYNDLYPDYQYTHYCPNCGAKMEEKLDDEA